MSKIRNVTALIFDGEDGTSAWDFVFSEALLDHTLPFLLILSVVLLTLIPCCLMTCRSKKRTRLSMAADSENTEELAGLRFENVDLELGKKRNLEDDKKDLSGEMLTRRNLERWARSSLQFTRLESIDEEGSRTSSIKTNSTIGDLADTVMGLRNSLYAESGGRLNEKITNQLDLLMGKLKCLKDRAGQRLDYAEDDSGMALLTPSHKGLMSMLSYESNGKSNEVFTILENIRSGTEDLKYRIERTLKQQKIDENVLAVVEKEISQSVAEMLQSIPIIPKLSSLASPKLGSGPPSNQWNNVLAGLSGPSSSDVFQTEVPERNSWSPKSEPSCEYSPTEEMERLKFDDIFPKVHYGSHKEDNFIKNEEEAVKVTKPQLPTENCVEENGGEVKNKKEIPFKESIEDDDRIDARQDLKTEDHGLWELEMAMIGMKEDIDRSIESHTPKGSKKTFFNPLILAKTNAYPHTNGEVVEDADDVKLDAQVDHFIAELYNNADTLGRLEAICKPRNQHMNTRLTT